MLHRNFQQCTQCVQVIDGRKAFALLPFVNCLGLFKAKVALDVPNGQALFLSQAQDVFSRCGKVNNREIGLVRTIASFALSPDGYYKI